MKTLLFKTLYQLSKAPYRLLFKHTPAWRLTAGDLLHLPPDSLGFQLAEFLRAHGFDLEPHFEDHDAIHVLTSTGVSVQEEIGMQFLLLGNGKRSAYLLMVVAVGAASFPSHWRYFSQCYADGKKARPFHDLDFYRALDQPLGEIRARYGIVRTASIDIVSPSPAPPQVRESARGLVAGITSSARRSGSGLPSFHPQNP